MIEPNDTPIPEETEVGATDPVETVETETAETADADGPGPRPTKPPTQ